MTPAVADATSAELSGGDKAPRAPPLGDVSPRPPSEKKKKKKRMRLRRSCGRHSLRWFGTHRGRRRRPFEL